MFNPIRTGCNYVLGLSAVLATFCLATASYGKSLLPEKPLNHYAALDNQANNQYNPHLTTDGKGNWLSMWTSPGYDYTYDPGAYLSLASSSTTGTSWGPAKPAPFANPGILSSDLVYAGDDKWVAIWIEGSIPPINDSGILVSFSEDVGQTWSEPKVIYGGPEVSVETVILRSDGNGNLLALWVEGYDYFTSHSSDHGETWTAPALLNGIQPSLAFGTRFVSLASSDQNTWLIVYRKFFLLDSILGGRHIYHVAKSENNGSSWTDLGQLFMQGDFHGMPYDFIDISIQAHEGRAVIAAVGRPLISQPGEGNNMGIIASVSDDNQTTFSSPVWVEQPADGNFTRGNVSLAVDSAGNWLLAAKGNSPYPELLKLWRTSDPAEGWTLWKEYDQGYAAELAAVGAGNEEFVVLMAHYDDLYHNADLDIAALGTLGDGIWSEPVYVNEGATSDLNIIQDYEVDLAAGDNMILASWIAETRFPPAAAPEWKTNRIMFSRSYDGGRTWEPAWEMGRALQTDSVIRNLKIRHAGPGTWECFWVVPNVAEYRAVSHDAGQTWSSPEVITAFPQENKFIADAGNGELIGSITQVSFDPGLNVYTLSTYVGVSSDGGLSWHSPTLIQSDTRPPANYESYYRGDPEVVSLGGGRIALLGRHLFIGRDNFTEFFPLKKFHAFLAESTDYGRTWSSPETVTETVNFTRETVDYPTPMVTSNGRIVVAWSQKGPGLEDDFDILFRSKTFGSQTAARDWSLYE